MRANANRVVVLDEIDPSNNVTSLKDRDGIKAAKARRTEAVPADFAPSVLANDGEAAALRWTKGERLNHLVEHSCDLFGPRDAIITDAGALTYAELDARANQLARSLIAQGVMPGHRVGLLFDKSAETYVALLAVLKAHAVYVPLDAAFPAGRLNFIVSDAELAMIVSMSSLAKKLDGVDVPHIFLDKSAPEIAAMPIGRLGAHEVAPSSDNTCYIIYTSGTTGNPKGVMIEHASICNFVRVASELYGFQAGDRVYQGMTIAFDFSVEEIWVPLLVGATLVPGNPGRNLVGDELGDFLHERGVTCMCCCPTLVSTIERDLPLIRVLLVGGEACPRNLVERWYRDGRTILNSYGPTEATVTAMLTELSPDKPVTIGQPLPTYSIVVLDPEQDRAVRAGERGEIGIAGIGLARGYLNNDELTAQKFIPDFLDLPGNHSKRIYRTGDLGVLNAEGEIEYLGRIDSQVKIRGYRIELSEIEAVILEFPQIAQAAVSTYEPEPGMVELVAYYVRTSDGDSLNRDALAAALRTRLPAYMVPAYLEELDALPMSVSNKTDYKKLPAPTSPRFFVSSGYVAPENQTERALCSALAETLKYEQISIDDDFFQDLGANSLLMAKFCTKVRQTPALTHISMQDIYVCPTVRQLAEHLERQADQGSTVLTSEPEPLNVPSDFAYWGCGALQLAYFAGYLLLVLWMTSVGFTWIDAASDRPVEFFFRSLVATTAIVSVLAALPIAAKWLLIGRWQPGEFPIWGLQYFRFWVVKTLVRSSPANLFVGTPVYNVYLRLLGARIGRNVVIEARYIPVGTDLFSVGDNTILRKESVLLGYRAQSNRIHVGRIDIGREAFVGEAAVLDIDTRMGDRTQLGHASSLQSGQHVPDGKRYHGSPAIETTTDYCPIEALPMSEFRRGAYSVTAVAGHFILTGPLLLMVLSLVLHTGNDALAGSFTLSTMLTVAGLSLALFGGGLVLGLITVLTVPRLLRPFLKTDVVYPLFGIHYWMQRVVSATSNSQLYNLIFGDSSYIIHYLRMIGWDLGKVQQTGSNFGTNQRHDNPFLCRIGSGTMVSDGLSMMNMQMSASSFCLKPTAVGENCYFGNDIHYPAGARVGNNCLLGTKVLVPVDGPMRENVGLLGSPSFEIPRVVERDRNLIASLDETTRLRRIGEKNRHNLVSIGYFLATRWLFSFMVLLAAHLAILGYASLGIFSVFLSIVGLSIVMIGYFALIERASLGFGRLKPTMITIYDPEFWSHERHWKLSDSAIVGLLTGTPFRNIISRMLGIRVGRKVYDGGATITERTLTEIGDFANLNEASVLQAHSLEEGAFKSDVIVVGTGCTVGPAAFVHYGVRMGERSVLDADSFLIKGETLEAGTGWRGNPAKLHRSPEVRPQTKVGLVIAANPSWPVSLGKSVELVTPKDVSVQREAHQ